MSCNLKALGLALVAMLALGAMSASAASATDVFTSAEEVETVTGLGVYSQFSLGETKSVQCQTVNFHGSINNGITQATVVAEHVGMRKTETSEATHSGPCSSSWGGAIIDMNECAYILTGETTGDDLAVEGPDATVWVECEPESEIEVTFPDVGGTTISIPAQTPTEGGVTYTNNTPEAGEVTIHTTAAGVTYSCSPHFFCTLAGVPIEGDFGVYTGTFVVHGENGDISVSEEEE